MHSAENHNSCRHKKLSHKRRPDAQSCERTRSPSRTAPFQRAGTCEKRNFPFKLTRYRQTGTVLVMIKKRMNFTPDNYLLIFSVLLFASILASKASYKIGVPMLLLFLGIGILAGQEIVFENTLTTSLIGELALVFILFAGGLDTKFRDVRPVLPQGIILSTLGVLLTAGLLGFAIFGLSNLPFVAIHFTLPESLLLGAIVSSTDAASVFSIFRSQRTTLKNNLRPMLELESGSNDPMAYVLTVSLVTYLVAQNTGTEIPQIRTAVFQLTVSLGLGAALGFAFGKLMVFVINKAQLYVEGLYPVLILAMTAFAFAATKMLNGNGFLAVYLAGLILGNANFIHKRSMLNFHEGFAWLMQLLLFISLGLFANFAAIKAVAVVGIIISLILIFAVRPLAVALCLAPFRAGTRALAFVSWVGLRGAVPIVFALIPLSTPGFDEKTATLIFNIVFFISVSSLVLQGTTLFKTAKWLRLTVDENTPPPSAFDRSTEDINTVNAEITLSKNDAGTGKTLAELAFPHGTLVVMMKRGENFLTPRGNVVLQAGDILQLQADTPEHLRDAEQKLTLGN